VKTCLPIICRAPVSLILALLALSLSGCRAPRYQLILNSGAMIETRGKPKLDPDASVYRYKDVSGRKGTVPIVGVREIAPL
jgi:hypothetical protein